MKTNIFITLLFSLLFTCSYGQKEVTRTIDWQKLNKINKSGITQGVRNRDFAIFEIKNINKFLYQVEISGESIDLRTEMPDELKKLFRISIADQGEESIDEEGKKALDNAALGKELMDTQEGTPLAVSVAFTADKKATLETTINDLVDACTEYLKVANEIELLKAKRIELINLAKSDKSFKDISKKAKNIYDKNPFEELRKFEVVYENTKKLYEKAAKEAADADSDTRNRISYSTFLIKESYKVLEEEDWNQICSDIKYLLEELQNERNFIVTAPPVQMVDDVINYTVTINPITSNNLAPFNQKTEFSFDVPSNSGLEVDFSVGPTVSFGSNALDEKYYLEPASTDGFSVLRQRDNNNSGTPGLAAMMHFYDRVATETALGGLFGVGAGFQSVDDVNLSFYLGGTVVLGKKQKIMLNAGLSFLSVERLKNKQYIVDNEYATDSIDLDDVTEKVFKSSFFISLSYNLTKRM